MERPPVPRRSSSDLSDLVRSAAGGPRRGAVGRSSTAEHGAARALVRGAGSVGGLVLCGGASRRMGRDKAGLELAGRALIEHAIAVLSARAGRVRLACGTTPRYGELGHPLVQDRAGGLGPLAGLEAGLAAARDAGEDCVLVLACDMPCADARIFDALLARTIEEDLDGCVLASARGREPLYAVYRTRLAGPVRAALDAGVRRLDALEHLAFGGDRGGEAGRPVRIGVLRQDELGPELQACDPALNLNTQDDLDRARAALESPAGRAAGRGPGGRS